MGCCGFEPHKGMLQDSCCLNIKFIEGYCYLKVSNILIFGIIFLKAKKVIFLRHRQHHI